MNHGQTLNFNAVDTAAANSHCSVAERAFVGNSVTHVPLFNSGEGGGRRKRDTRKKDGERGGGGGGGERASGRERERAFCRSEAVRLR